MDTEPPAAEIRGEWVFTELAPNRTQVELRHHVSAPADADLGPRLDWIEQDSKEHLDTLRDTAERRAELDELVLSFTDPLFIAGSIEDAYDYLYRADLWPERIPHVVGLAVTEDEPNIQFFDMDTKGPDGGTHTVRSVRICMPPRLIVYKQIVLPAMLGRAHRPLAVHGDSGRRHRRSPAHQHDQAFGGRQHTLEQLSELAEPAGLEIASILPAGRMSIVELRAPC
jgi:hypothetical protein